MLSKIFTKLLTQAVKTVTVAEVSWEIDNKRDQFLHNEMPKNKKGTLRLQKMIGSSAKWISKEYFFRFHDGQNDLPLIPKDYYWSISEFSSFRPHKQESESSDLENAVNAVIENKSGKSVLLVPKSQKSFETNWIQLTETIINCYYPHDDDPVIRFPELVNNEIVARLEAFEPSRFLTVELKFFERQKLVFWISRYFLLVLNLNTYQDKIRYHIE